jgi:hypothetical protein
MRIKIIINTYYTLEEKLQIISYIFLVSYEKSLNNDCLQN